MGQDEKTERWGSTFKSLFPQGKEILISDETESENCLFMWGKMKLNPYLTVYTKIPSEL